MWLAAHQKLKFLMKTRKTSIYISIIFPSGLHAASVEKLQITAQLCEGLWNVF